jgi:hypothetical protein
MPALFPVIEAALAAGAKGVAMEVAFASLSSPWLLPSSGAFLSGAGSSIMALTSGMRGDVYTQHHSERKDRNVGLKPVSQLLAKTYSLSDVAQKVASAMVEAAASAGVTGRVYITKVGARRERGLLLNQITSCTTTADHGECTRGERHRDGGV